MKAVIMAGGEGSRLRPVTCDTPKPMVRLCGRPVIEYILDLLAQHGFTQASVTLRYLPGRLSGHFGEQYKDITLTFIEETQPLGTAGSVKNACGPKDDEILVISGDAMCDFDLGAAVRQHRQKGSDATILVKRVTDPREYGLVVAGDDMRITGFVEKPAFSQAVSDLANTGVYILSKKALDLIAPGRACDFAQELFPLMLGRGMKLYAREDGGYWCDIGDLPTYLRCQQDMLKGLVRCALPGVRDGEGNVFCGGRPRGEYTLAAPVYLGENVVLERGAVVEQSVIEDGCVVMAGGQVSRSALLTGSFVGADASVSEAVLCADATVKRGGSVLPGAAIGARAVVGEHARIGENIRIWPDKAVDASAMVRDHVTGGRYVRPGFDEEGLTGASGIELTAEFCARVGAAAAGLPGISAIAVAHAEGEASLAYADALAAGIRASGADVIRLGRCYESLFRFGVSHCRLSLGVFVDAVEGAVKFACSGGLWLPRYTERTIESAMLRGDYRRRPAERFGRSRNLEGISILYENDLVSKAGDLSGLMAQARSENRDISDLMERVLSRAGCSCGKTELQIAPQGGELSAREGELRLAYANIQMLCAAAEFQQGKDAALIYGSACAANHLAVRFDRRVLRYYQCPADDSDKEARALAAQQRWSFDGIAAAVRVLSMLRDTGATLRTLAAAVPGCVSSARTIPVEGNPAALVSRLASGAIREGALINDPRGTVLVKPTKKGNAIRVTAEAFSAEVAEELCQEIERLLQ